MQTIASDPVAQARYFILTMRFFCEHVLGLGQFDDCLRHNGSASGPIFPDSFAASGLGGAFGMVAACHGPIEEQARLSIHPHINLWFVHNSSSEAWLRSILKRETQRHRRFFEGGKRKYWPTCSRSSWTRLLSRLCCWKNIRSSQRRLALHHFRHSTRRIAASMGN